MSMGYGGKAILEETDDTMLLYFYCSYNANNEDYDQYVDKYDGSIWIKRDSLLEPEKYEKKVKKPNGRRVLEERIRIRKVDIVELVNSGQIKIENASGAWRLLEDGSDFMAYRLIDRIFTKYQEMGDIPKQVAFFS